MFKCRCCYLLSGFLLLATHCKAMASPIPDINDAYFQGSNQFENVDPRTACSIFNQNVELINASIKDKYPELGDMEFSKNLCQVIRVNEIQDEATFETMYSAWPDEVFTRFFSIFNTYDLARTTDILIFSGSGKTDYLMMVNGDVNFAKQKHLGNEYQGNEVAPISTSLGGVGASLSAAIFFHNTEITNLIVDASVYDSEQ